MSTTPVKFQLCYTLEYSDSAICPGCVHTTGTWAWYWFSVIAYARTISVSEDTDTSVYVAGTIRILFRSTNVYCYMYTCSVSDRNSVGYSSMTVIKP